MKDINKEVTKETISYLNPRKGQPKGSFFHSIPTSYLPLLSHRAAGTFMTLDVGEAIAMQAPGGVTGCQTSSPVNQTQAEGPEAVDTGKNLAFSKRWLLG